MKKIITIALVCLSVVGVAAASSLAANNGSVIYDSTTANGAPTNEPSYGPESYAYKTIGDKITFAGTNRSLSSVTVTLSSFACQQGAWFNQDCVSKPGATFAQPMTLNIYDAATYNTVDPSANTPIATSAQTFNVTYRPSASPKCTGKNAGKWLSPATGCRNGITDDVTFPFSNVKLPSTVVYEISYNTSNYGPNPTHAAGPADSLNVAVGENTNSVDPFLWIDGQANSTFDGNTQGWTPLVQFKASNA